MIRKLEEEDDSLGNIFQKSSLTGRGKLHGICLSKILDLVCPCYSDAYKIYK